MRPASSDQSVADAFLKLNTPEKLPNVSKYGLWISWIAIVLFGASLAGIAFLILDLDRRGAEIRLRQATEEVAQTMEDALQTTANILQRTAPRLMHARNDRYLSESAKLSAMSFMNERPEVAEISLVDIRSMSVLRSWTSATAPSGFSLLLDERLQAGDFALALGRAEENGAPSLSEPVSDPGTGSMVSGLVVPTPVKTQVLVACIRIDSLLTSAVRLAAAEDYQFALIDEEDRPAEASSLKSKTSLRLLDYETKIEGRSFEHALSTADQLPILLIAALLLMLAMTIAWLFYFQRQQHRSHQFLMAEYALRRAMSESAVVGLRVTDPEGRILYVNETFQRLLGMTARELVGQMPPYSYWAEASYEHLKALLSSGKAALEPVPFLARRKSGEVFHAELRLSPLRDAEGAELGFIGALYDVTPQARAREALVAANERFTRVVQSLSSGLVVLSETHELLFANDAYERLFGTGPEGAVRLLKAQKALKATEERDGIFDESTGRWFYVRSQPITWTQSITATLLIATDITTRRRYEIELEAQMRRAESTQRLVTMGEMASSLAHELNQPLSAMSNYAGGAMTLMDAGRLTPERMRQAFTKIENQAVRAGRIIQRIRGFAKKTSPRLTSLSVDTVLQETMELALIQAKKLQGTVALEVEPGLPAVHGDSVLIEQLLLNLIRNALEAMADSKNRTAVLRVRSEGADSVRFSVIDRGPGITDEEKQKLFNAFYSTKSEGMGIGLNICRSIAELHGGHLDIADTPGGGATFSFAVRVETAGE